MNHWITLLRHGESEGNKAGVLQGQIDSPLTEIGRQQARQIGLKWLDAGVQFDQFISSPLKRAQQTGEIIAEILGYKNTIKLDPIWMERSFGKFEGKSYNQLQEINPPVDYYQPYQPIGEHGESQLDLYLRAAKGLQHILREEPKKILVVSHGALISKILYAVLGITPQRHSHSPVFSLGNTTYINLKYASETQQWFFYGIHNPKEWSGMERE